MAALGPLGPGFQQAQTVANAIAEANRTGLLRKLLKILVVVAMFSPVVLYLYQKNNAFKRFVIGAVSKGIVPFLKWLPYDFGLAAVM